MWITPIVDKIQRKRCTVPYMELPENTIETVEGDFEEEESEDLRPRNKAEHLKPYHWKPGESGNPGGRPKDPLRDYVRRKFAAMTDVELDAWLAEHKVSGEFQWRQAEGNPTEDRTITLKVPTPILGGMSTLAVEATQTGAQGQVNEALNAPITRVNEDTGTLVLDNVGTEPDSIVPTT